MPTTVGGHRLHDSLPTTAPPPPVMRSTVSPIRFHEVQSNKTLMISLRYNKLAAYYLQLVRETGNPRSHSRAALAIRPRGTGLADCRANRVCLAQLARARDHAIQLTKLEPGKAILTKYW